MNSLITMNAQVLLLLAIFSPSIWKLGCASRNLPRDGETFDYPDLGGITGAALGGLGWLLDPPTTDPNSDPGTPALDQNPNPETPTLEQIPDPATPTIDPNADLNSQPRIELQVDNSQPAVGYDNCDPGSDSFPLFGSVVRYIPSQL